MVRAQLEYLPIESLSPYPGNARTHSRDQVAQLAASMREFGFTNPVLIDVDGGVIAGHGRLLAAMEVGLSEVPCLRLGYLTDAQKRALVIADNRLALGAGWDLDVLALELMQLHTDGFDLTLTGFSEDELGGLMHRLDGTEGFTDVDDVPSLGEVAVSRAGDVWLCGAHRVACGDSTRAEVVQAAVNGGLVDLVLTDPPYGVAYEGSPKGSRTGTGVRKAIANDALAGDELRGFLAASFEAAKPALRPGGAFYIWHADGLVGLHFRRACEDVGWQVRQCLVWVKSSATIGRQDYQWGHEACLYGWAADDARLYDEEHMPCLYGWQEGAGHAWQSDRKQTTVLQFERPARSVEHPTMKPVAMFEYQLRNSTLPGQVVLDFFAGSGTAVIAAEHSGRACCAVELDPLYVDVIVRRWQAFTGEKAVREADSVPFDEVDAALEQAPQEVVP